MLMSDPVLFADFLDLETTLTRRIYRPVTDPTKLRQTLEEFHMRLNVSNTAVSVSLIHPLLSVCHYSKVILYNNKENYIQISYVAVSNIVAQQNQWIKQSQNHVLCRSHEHVDGTALNPRVGNLKKGV